MATQDEVIDIIACEISKDAKKKSDILIDLEVCKAQCGELRKTIAA